MEEKKTIDQLYRDYGYIIHGRCLMILKCPDKAHDATQVVFMKLMEKYATIRDKEKVVPWLFKTATNYCFNQLRSEKKFVDAIDADDVGAFDTQHDTMDNKYMIALIFKNLDKRVRDAVYYTHVENLSQEEIRSVTNQSPATIRRNLKKFKDSIPLLKKKLGLV